MYNASSILSSEELDAIEQDLKKSFRLDLPVVFRKMQSEQWQQLWKRREWDQIDFEYDSNLTETELLSQLSD